MQPGREGNELILFNELKDFLSYARALHWEVS